MLKRAAKGDPKACRIVEVCRADGCTDSDILQWRNFTRDERVQVLANEHNTRRVAYEAACAAGMSDADAIQHVLARFPEYGDPTTAKGDDRPLPHELRGRVDKFRLKHGTELIQSGASQYSSFNAFIRSRVRLGEL